MKKIFIALLSACMALVSGCSVTQELSDDVSFAGLKKFYVEDSAGGNSFFKSFTDLSEVNVELKKQISDFLVSKGFEKVDDKTNAQIIFRPLWSVSNRSTDESMKSLPIDIAVTPNFMNEALTTCVTLEIQAIIPDNGKIWSWRGFAPTEITQRNFNIGMMHQLVVWCLDKFPPEDYPSRLQEHKEQKEQKRIQQEENPFKEVLIKERQRQESQSSNSSAVEK